MTYLPPIPQKEGIDRNWSPETWRTGLDEAVRLNGWPAVKTWQDVLEGGLYEITRDAIIAHATTLIKAGIVKPVVSEAAALLERILSVWPYTPELYLTHDPAAIAVIQAALDKARSGE